MEMHGVMEERDLVEDEWWGCLEARWRFLGGWWGCLRGTVEAFFFVGWWWLFGHGRGLMVDAWTEVAATAVCGSGGWISLLGCFGSTETRRR